MKKNIPYVFECKTFTEYEIVVTMEAGNKLLENIFTRSREKLARKKGINVSGDISGIQAFDIDERFLPLVKTIMKKSLVTITKEVKSDGIELLTMIAKKGKFKRKDEQIWEIEVIFQGDYADKR